MASRDADDILDSSTQFLRKLVDALDRVASRAAMSIANPGVFR
jgi:hypothetical protein